MKFKARDAFAGVKGRSIIDHRIRIKTNTTCQEYCILEFIHHLNQEKKEKYNADFHAELMHKAIGYHPEGLIKVIRTLMDKGLLHIDDEGIMTTQQWDQHFFQDIITEFESLWARFGRVGNKPSALDMYRRARKEGEDYQHLSDRLDVYVKHIEDTGTYVMHMSSWLNPKYKKYNDEYENARKKENVQQSGFSI